MITLHYPEIPREKNLIAATGFFDGVHAGHRAILHDIVSEAKKENKKSCIVTFWPHPRIVLGKTSDSFRMLTTIDEKIELISKLGIDYFYLIPFTQSFSLLTAEQFFEKVLVKHVNIAKLYMGYNHRFGHESQNETIEDIGKKLNVDVVRIPAVKDGDITISSTKIRNALLSGDIELANEMLGYDFSIIGVVVRGNQIGRTLGFPTANIQPHAYKLIPKNGVYAVTVKVKNIEYKGMLNIGLRPTLNNTEKPIVEVNIFDFDEDIYDLIITIRLIKRVREEQPFKSLDVLSDQLKKDEVIIREILTN